MNEQLFQHMELAVQIGKQSRAEDSRFHPKVGAVITMDDKVIETAFRGELGDGDHAEYTLLEKNWQGLI